MNLNDFMASSGFLNHDNTGATQYSQEDVCKMLHENDPIKMLKEYNIFTDKNITSELKYLNDYVMTKQWAVFLMQRSFTLHKNVCNNTAIFSDKDVGLCPIYQIIVKDENNTIIDNKDYVFSFTLESSQNTVPISLDENGYLIDTNHWFEMFGQTKPTHYKKHNIRTVIYNDYTDHLTITFHNHNYENITIEINSYDLYGYANFFTNGWLFI